VASKPGRSRDATSTRHSRSDAVPASSSCDTATRARLCEGSGSSSAGDAFGDGRVVAGGSHRFGAPALDEVAGVEAREVGLFEHGEDEVVQLVEAGPVPRLQPAEGEGEQVQGPDTLGPVEVGGEREHPLLVEAVDP
jgi:hypothetical protein